MHKQSFSAEVEKLVNPISVGSLHFIQMFNKLLPKAIQKRLVTSSSKKIPFMGFVVEPYSFFLCYEIADTDIAKSLLPDNFELVQTSIFQDDDPKYYCIFGCFRAHTSAFWGVRNEFYVIAEDRKTGLLSWIIIDYDTDTISYDSQNGLRSPNCISAVLATDYTGTLTANIQNNDHSRGLEFTTSLDKGNMKTLNQRLWLEGNLSIGYGRVLSQNNADIFSLKFQPEEVAHALDIPLQSLSVGVNSWYPGLFKPMPARAVCFPYAQHFVSDSPGHTSKLQNKDQLMAANAAIDFSTARTFSAKSFLVMFAINAAVSAIIIITLGAIAIFK
jgi:hypothetical protein